MGVTEREREWQMSTVDGGEENRGEENRWEELLQVSPRGSGEGGAREQYTDSDLIGCS